MWSGDRGLDSQQSPQLTLALPAGLTLDPVPTSHASVAVRLQESTQLRDRLSQLQLEVAENKGLLSELNLEVQQKTDRVGRGGAAAQRLPGREGAGGREAQPAPARQPRDHRL